MKTKLLTALLTAALCLGMLAGCGGDSGNADAGNSNATTTEVWENGGVAYLTEDGEVMLLKDLDGEGESIKLSENGGTFPTDTHYFTNTPPDSKMMHSAVFSKDGTKLYYFTNIDGSHGDIYCADIENINDGLSKSSITKLTSDVRGRTTLNNDGIIYTSRKNGDWYLYFDGNKIGEVRFNGNAANEYWMTNTSKGVVYVTDDNDLMYTTLNDLKQTVLMEHVSEVWYDGGNWAYCLDDYGSDRESGSLDLDLDSADNELYALYRVNLSGQKEKLLSELYSVEGVIDGRIYYTYRYIEKIQWGVGLDQPRYELWCYDGKNNVKLCNDYYSSDYSNSEYAWGDTYNFPWEEYKDYEDYREDYKDYESDEYWWYVFSEDFLKKYWDAMLLEHFCFLYELDADTPEEFFSLLHSDEFTESVYEEYLEQLEDLDAYEYLFNARRRPGFYADERIAVYTRAIKNELSDSDYDYIDHDSGLYWEKLLGSFPFECSASYTFADGRSGNIEGVHAKDFIGLLGDNWLVFVTDENIIKVYDIQNDTYILQGKYGKKATLNGEILYFYNREGELICFNGEEELVLADDNVYSENNSSWVYTDGITLALYNADDEDGTLKIFRNGEGKWIADDVTYYQRISEDEIIYISDGTLFIYTIDGETVQLADNVVGAYGAYYGGTLIGYTSAS